MLIYVTEVTVPDPDTKVDVTVEIYKDSVSGALFGVDGSWPQSYIWSPYDETKSIKLELPED